VELYFSFVLMQIESGRRHLEMKPF